MMYDMMYAQSCKYAALVDVFRKRTVSRCLIVYGMKKKVGTSTWQKRASGPNRCLDYVCLLRADIRFRDRAYAQCVV